MGPKVTTGLRKPAAGNTKNQTANQNQKPDSLRDVSWPELSDCSPSLRTTRSYAGNFVWTGWEERSSLLFLRFLLELRRPRKRQKSARSPPAVLGSVYCTLESCSALMTNGRKSQKLPGAARASGCVVSLAQLATMLPTLKNITQTRVSVVLFWATLAISAHEQHLASVAAVLSHAAFEETRLPVFVGDDAPFNFLVVLADANGQPGAQLAVVQGVHHTENLPFVEAQAVGRFLLILKVCPDVERVANIRLHDPPIH